MYLQTLLKGEMRKYKVRRIVAVAPSHQRWHDCQADDECRETYAADEALQQCERSKDDQDRLVIHLERQIDIQKARLVKQERQKCNEEMRSSQIQEAVKQTSASIRQVNMEAEAKLQLWKDGLAELHRKDEQLQVCEACIKYLSPLRFAPMHPLMMSQLVWLATSLQDPRAGCPVVWHIPNITVTKSDVIP